MADDGAQDLEQALPAVLMDQGTIGGLTRAELDVQIMTAHRFRRNPTTVRRAIETLATMDTETALSCRYQKPQRVKNPVTGKWENGFIEGPSARFAEIVLASWGNARVASRRTNLTEADVEATGIFHDLESNVARAVSVRRGILTNKGERFPDHLIETVSNAVASIAMRNAVLAGIPRAVWGSGYAKALAIIKGDISTLVQRRAEMIRMWGDLGINPDQVYAVLDVKGRDDIDVDMLFHAAGLMAAIRDGDTSFEELMAQRNQDSRQNKPGLDAAFGKSAGPATVDNATSKPKLEETQQPHTAEVAGDPLVVNGVKYPNATRANEARRKVKDEAKSAQGAEGGKATSASATVASTASAEETSSQAQPSEQSNDGEMFPGDRAAKSAGAEVVTEEFVDPDTGVVYPTMEARLAATKAEGEQGRAETTSKSPASSGASPSADDKAATEAMVNEDFNAFAKFLPGKDSWLTIKSLLITLANSKGWTAAPTDLQDLAFMMAWERVAELNDPVSPSSDPTFFRVHLRAWQAKKTPNRPDDVFRVLCRSKDYQKLNDAHKDQIGDEIEAYAS